MNLSLFLEYLFKFLIIGSASTGKSCILHQFVENKCNCLVDYNFRQRMLLITLFLVKNDTTHTIGAEFGSKIITIGQQQVKLQIWDVSYYFLWINISAIVVLLFENRPPDKNDFDQSLVVIIAVPLVHYLFMISQSKINLSHKEFRQDKSDTLLSIAERVSMLFRIGLQTLAL